MGTKKTRKGSKDHSSDEEKGEEKGLVFLFLFLFLFSFSLPSLSLLVSFLSLTLSFRQNQYHLGLEVWKGLILQPLLTTLIFKLTRVPSPLEATITRSFPQTILQTPFQSLQLHNDSSLTSLWKTLVCLLVPHLHFHLVLHLHLLIFNLVSFLLYSSFLVLYRSLVPSSLLIGVSQVLFVPRAH
jgi:hypothetical protein